MRSCRPAFISVVAVAALLGLAASASAEPIPIPFEDDFQDTSVGAYPSASGWLVGSLGDGAVVSVTGPDDARSFRLQGRFSAPRFDYVRLADVPDTVSYEASVCADAASGRVAVVGFVNLSAGTFINSFEVDARTGVVSFYGAAKYTIDPAVYTYAPGTWCAVRADFDFSAPAPAADLYLWDWVAEEWCFLQAVEAAPRQSVLSGDTLTDHWGVSAPSPTMFEWINVAYFDDLSVSALGLVDTIPVDVDIKPGADPNSVNLDSRGSLPVAIFGTDSFDVTQIDLYTLDVAGAGVAARGRSGKLMANVADLDADGYLDLLFHVAIQDLDPSLLSEGTALVTGYTLSGEYFEGSDDLVLRVR